MKTRSKTKLEKDNAVVRDRISRLPSEAMEGILASLPIRDAVRTSILSSKWKRKWTTIPSLVFDDSCVQPSSSDNTIQDCGSNFVRFVTQVLSHHKGPIQKLKLCGKYLKYCPENGKGRFHIAQSWIEDFVSWSEIKELTIICEDDEDYFSVPDCVYSFEYLTHLELLGCRMYSLYILEEDFSDIEFSNLVTLNLQNCDFSTCTIEDLVLRCPRLESFTLSYHSFGSLYVRGPNLKYLFIEGAFRRLTIVDTPLLAVLHVHLHMTVKTAKKLQKPTTWNMLDVIDCAPCLERFTAEGHFIKLLSKNVPNRLPKYDHIKKLELYSVAFEDVDEIQAVICLMENSPNLEELICSSRVSEKDGKEPDLDYWETKHLLGYSFARLRNVKMGHLSGYYDEIEFIRFLLAKSPVLERMSIEHCILATDFDWYMLLILLDFPRASGQAGVFVTKGDHVEPSPEVPYRGNPFGWSDSEDSSADEF